MTEDLHKILLTPIAGEHTPDSTPTVADCGHRCWIAPSSRKVVDNPFVRTETVCPSCVDRDELRAALAEQGGPLAMPGAREEVSRHLGVGETDQLWARFRVRDHNPQDTASRTAGEVTSPEE